jgi:hypothetical protein
VFLLNLLTNRQFLSKAQSRITSSVTLRGRGCPQFAVLRTASVVASMSLRADE